MATLPSFKGLYTAIITPFDEDGGVDVAAYENLVGLQLAARVDGLVPCGTTGECPTLSDEEQAEIIARTVQLCAGGKAKVIAGTGSNDTAHAVHLARQAEKLGVTAVMVVNPYYNKPTQEGLYRHFRAIAGSIDLPVMIYNIKSRTGVNLETSTLVRIVEACSNVVAVKEASGDLKQIQEVIERPSLDSFSVLSGDDNLTSKVMALGGDGVVSVASNLYPKQMKSLVDALAKKDLAAAEAMEQKLAPLFEGIFLETNPIPVKTALASRKLIKEQYRLPMCEMGSEARAKWFKILEGLDT